MSTINCVCGHQMTGEGDDALFAAIRAHSDSEHADLAITDAAIRAMVEAQARMTPWDGKPIAIAEPPDIRALTPALVDDFLRFFDRDAFMDNPIWAGCYCQFPHCAAADWDIEPERAASLNRADKAALIRRGEAHGHLAYDGDRVVGWCHAAPRTSLPMFATREQFAIDDADGSSDDDVSRIGSVVCFVIAAPYRRQGIARRLLNAACDGLRAQGMTIAEGYPKRGGASAEVSDAAAYHGPLEMYLNAGFAVHRENERHTIVRKPL